MARSSASPIASGLLLLTLLAGTALAGGNEDRFRAHDFPRGKGNLVPPADLAADHQKKLDDALEAFDKAIEKKASDGPIEARKEIEEAFKQLKARAAEDGAKAPVCFYYLALADEKLRHDTYTAAIDYKKATAANPKFYEAWVQLALIQNHLSDSKSAEDSATKALDASPDSKEALFERIDARIDQGKFPEAQDDVNHGMKISEPWFRHKQQRLKDCRDGPQISPKFEVVSDNYIVRTDVSQEFAVWGSKQLEAIRKVYNGVFKGLKPEPPKRKYFVCLYKSSKEYHDVWDEIDPIVKNAGGHYEPGTRQLFLPQYDKPRDTQETLYHEAFHQFIHPYLAECPQWLNEGLADYFAGFTYDDASGSCVPHMNEERFDHIQRAIKNHVTKFTLWELLHMSYAEMYDYKFMGLNYAMGWSFAHYLATNDPKALITYFKGLRGEPNKAPISNDDAVKNAFGDEKSFKRKFAAPWEDWIVTSPEVFPNADKKK